MMPDNGWHAHIDSFNGINVLGWAKKKSSNLPQYISLFHNGRCVEKLIPACLLREDVRKCGFGGGYFGFAYELEPPLANVGLLQLQDPETGGLLTEFAYNLAESLDTEALEARVDLLVNAGAIQSALECLHSLCQRAPSRIEPIELALKLSADKPEFKNFHEYFLEQQFIATGICSFEYAHMPLLDTRLPRKKALELALSRYMRSPLTRSNIEQIRHILSLFSELLQIEPAPVLKIAYNNFIRNYTIPSGSSYNCDFVHNKIAVYSHTFMQLAFILPVIRFLPNFIYDIIFDEEEQGILQLCEQYCIYNPTIRYGVDLLDSYGILLYDAWYHSNYLRNKIFNDKIIINYTHGTDACSDIPCRSNLYLLSYRNQSSTIRKMSIYFTDSLNFSQLKTIHPNHKVEIGYTGPYHLGKYLQCDVREKGECRRELEDILSVKIPPEKPLIVCYRDEWCYAGHIIHCLNKLSKYCTIILKLCGLPIQIHKKLNPDVIVYPVGGWAQNALRFGADFIMCGFDSGSFSTSLLLGQNVIPYYSRLVRYSTNEPWRKWTSVFVESNNHMRTCYTSLVRKNFPYYFDLLNVDEIKKAIFDPAYINWYRSQIPYLQNEIFGDYILEGADQKTAEYIVRFASEGTLGRDCANFFLKDSYFQELARMASKTPE